MHPVFQRSQPRREPRMRCGACGGDCGGTCSACPTDGGSYTITDIARLLGNREVVGLTGRCKYNMIHLQNANKAAGLAAGVSGALAPLSGPTIQFGLCVQQIVAVVREVAVPGTIGRMDLSNFMIGNKPQWIQGAVYSTNLFAFNAECSCCLPADCTTVGSIVSMTATNRGANAANVDVYLIGPATG